MSMSLVYKKEVKNSIKILKNALTRIKKCRIFLIDNIFNRYKSVWYNIKEL